MVPGLVWRLSVGCRGRPRWFHDWFAPREPGRQLAQLRQVLPFGFSLQTCAGELARRPRVPRRSRPSSMRACSSTCSSWAVPSPESPDLVGTQCARRLRHHRFLPCGGGPVATPKPSSSTGITRTTAYCTPPGDDAIIQRGGPSAAVRWDRRGLKKGGVRVGLSKVRKRIA